MHTANTAVPPSPTFTVIVVSDDTAAAAVAFTRTDCAPPSSTTPANTSPDTGSWNDKSTRVPASTIGSSADATVTADPPTDAAPDTVRFSPDSAAPSSGTVTINVSLADVLPAGIEIDTALLVKLVQASSPVPVGHDDPKEAPPPPATDTATAVADVRIDVAPLKLAVTVTDWAPDCSSTDAKDQLRSISASSSAIVNTDALASPNADDPTNSKVSGPSTTESSVIVKPANVAVPDGVTLLAGNVIVFADVGAYEKSAAAAFPAPAGVCTAVFNVTVVAEEITDDSAFQNAADTDTPEPESPSSNTA